MATDINKQYELQRCKGYSLFKLLDNANSTGAKVFELDFAEVLGEDKTPFVVDFGGKNLIDQAWLRAMLILVRDLKKASREAKFIGVSNVMVKQIKMAGLDLAFRILPDLAAALHELKIVQDSPKANNKVDTKFLNPFLDATVNVLKIQAQTEAKSQKIFVKDDSTLSLGDVSGVIGIVADKFNGAIVLTFPEKTFLTIMSRMMGETYTKLVPELNDGAGELVNIIFGQAKIELNNLGYGIKTALPSIIVGKQHNVAEGQAKKTLVVSFTSDAGDFFVEISTSE